MIVITLTKVPNSLRGDLTKWCQQIQTGVYVGNFNTRIRDLLWERIVANIGNGQATMVYTTNNEQGYAFNTTRDNYQVVNYDGIELMMQLLKPIYSPKHGFSNAAKYHRAKMVTRKTLAEKPNAELKQTVALDIETTGLNPFNDQIISIGGVQLDQSGDYQKFSEYIKTKNDIPKEINQLTGISASLLDNKGIPLSQALEELTKFIGDRIIVGYNYKFDERFLTMAFQNSDKEVLSNRSIDLMSLIKRKNKFFDNYRLNYVLEKYGIENKHPHSAVSDALATFNLMIKLYQNDDLQF